MGHYPAQPRPQPHRTGSPDAEHLDVAFDAFVQSNFPSWVRLAHLYMGDREDAEQVACEVSLRLHETWEQVLGEADNLPLYAFSVLRARIEDRFAQRAGDRMVENAAFLRAMRAARREFAVLAESIGVYSAISRLPERQFQVIALRYVLGYDVKRTASLMGVSQQTISSLTYYAKRALAGALGSAVREPDPERGQGPVRDQPRDKEDRA